MELCLKTKKNLPEEIYSDMEKQFPPEELKTFTELNNLLHGNFYKFAMFYNADEPVGYVFFLQNDYIWIDYIAVFEKFHSKGYGSRILNLIFIKYSNLKGCFFEVEPEDSDNIQTVKRMNFYKKLGCKKLDFEYYFPNEIKELRLELLYKPFNEKIPDKNEIKKQINFVFENLHTFVKTKDSTLNLIESRT